MNLSPIEAEAWQDALDHLRAGDDLNATIAGYEQAIQAIPDEAMCLSLVVRALRTLQRMNRYELKQRGLLP